MAAGLPTFRYGQVQAQRAALGANRQLTLALVGAGGRGSALATSMAKLPQVRFTRVCDPDLKRAQSLSQALAKIAEPAPTAHQDYRAALDDPAVDAVIVATPDHWHGLITIHACQAGKHVYVEKPSSHNLWEGRQMVLAARRHKRVVQVGTQGRSAPYLFAAKDYIQSGRLGAVHLCKVFNLKPGTSLKLAPVAEPPSHLDYDRWLGPAPTRPFRPGLVNSWYYFYDYCGGDTGNDGVHQIDIARWLTGCMFPKSVQASGGKVAFPDSDGDVHDTQAATFDFGSLLMTFETSAWAPYMDKIAQDIRMGAGFPYWPQCATRIEIYGTKGLMYVGRHGGGWQVFGRPKQQSRPGELIAEMRGRFPDEEHQANFVASVREEATPNADIEQGYRTDILVHLANIATRLGGRTLRFDAATESILGDPDATLMMKRTPREPYVVPAMG